MEETTELDGVHINAQLTGELDADFRFFKRVSNKVLTIGEAILELSD